MKTKTSLFRYFFCILLILDLCPPPCALSQVPQGFNYQAVAHNSAGAPIASTTIQVKIGILSDTLAPVIVWEELHSSVKTNASGVFNLVIGTGTRQSGSALSFSDIDWTDTPLFIRIQINAQGSWKNLGSAMLWSVPYAMVSNDIGAPLKKLAVTGETDNLEEALFEVKNKDGQTIFAVYNEGVRVYVDDGSKGPKGGFAIGGFGTVKEDEQKYLFVSGDSIRAYIDSASVKGPKGGFAIGGFGNTKSTGEEYLRVTRDSTRIYINDINTKGPKGGFAIGGFGKVKDRTDHYFDVSTDTSTIIDPSQNKILWYPLKNAFLTGRVLIEKPDSVGENSFASGYESKAKGQYSQALGYQAIARGIYSTSIGFQSVANKDNSFAFGQWAQARNYESYAFGRGAIAEGFRSFAFGSAGVDSLGKKTGVAYAKGDYSFAIGQGSQALGFSSFTLGIADTASGWGATAMGYETTAKGGSSTSIGAYSVASGVQAFAGGNNSKASSFVSFAFGFNALASGIASVAMGGATNAIGDFSVALGVGTIASGHSSAAFGYKTEASGGGSTAMGSYAKAIGVWSFAAGDSSIASMNWAVALGHHTLANDYASFAGGEESRATGNHAFAFGCKTLASGPGSVALGDETRATNGDAFSIGYLSHANATYSAVFGDGTISNSYAAMVLGRFNDTTGMTNKDWYVSTDPAFEIGNGTSNTDRKNAFTVLQNSMTGINMINPQQMLDIAGGNGRVESGYNWLTDSDIRYKKNIADITDPLEKVMAMHGVTYDLIKNNPDTGSQKKNIGFIAQELETVVPEVVVTGSDGYKSVAYDKLTAVLTEAIKEQQKQIESYKSENDNLKSQVLSLREKVEQIETYIEEMRNQK
jgi:hypothetical protein